VAWAKTAIDAEANSVAIRADSFFIVVWLPIGLVVESINV
jgi:hypothetical protein